MNLSNLKDYQFVLLALMALLLILVFFYIIFYSIKRKYDSIDKHIGDKQDNTYKECLDEYEKMTDNLGIQSNKIERITFFKLVKKLFFKK